MALLQSCCCWHSLRKGSYASAVYTMAYFSLTLLITGVALHEDRQVLGGMENNTEPYNSSIIEVESTTTSTMVFNILVTSCSVLGLMSCTLLVYGIYSDTRQLLVPWIAVVVFASVVDVAHIVYLICLELRNFNPMTAIVFTLDFFLISFNIYSLLCVVSQYQEYRAGRGGAQQHRFPSAKVRYVSKPDLWPEGQAPPRGRGRGLSLVPTPTGGPTAVMGGEPPLSLVSPAHWSPSTCLLDAPQPTTHSPHSLSPGGNGHGHHYAEPGSTTAFSRSPSVRKHVQFNQLNHAEADQGHQGCASSSLQREASFKASGSCGRRRSAIQRAPLPEESSLELAEGNSGDAEVEVVELLGPQAAARLAVPPPAACPAAAAAPASHSATGAWLVPRPGAPRAPVAPMTPRVHYVTGSGGASNGVAT